MFRLWSYLKKEDIKWIEQHEADILKLRKELSQVMGEVSTMKRILADHLVQAEKKTKIKKPVNKKKIKKIKEGKANG